uniref:Alternative protein SVIL n=1 Tax=Homo sapiens TaxID=9606 RepID=L0R8G3_HUMAN|nr:alternative protein SVIL [Homo sapiens]
MGRSACWTQKSLSPSSEVRSWHLPTPAGDLNSNHGWRGRLKDLACPPVWNGREGPGNQDAIFLLVKVEKLPRDLEPNL